MARLLRALVVASAFVCAFAWSVRATEQGLLQIPTTGPISFGGPTGVAARLNTAIRATAALNNGATAPANGPGAAPLPFQSWLDTSGSPHVWKIYDGTNWVAIGTLDPSAHTFRIALGSNVAGTLPVANGGTGASSASGTALDNISGLTGTGHVKRTGTGTYAIATLVASEITDSTAAGRAMITAPNAAAQTALLSAYTGDAGSGGAKGLVPAPAAGDASAGKYLSAGGGWSVPAGSGGGASAHGQVRLTKSGSDLALCPFNGNGLVINGAGRSLTSCVTLAPSGLSAGTTYWIYAYWTGSAVALEASTAGRVTDAATGIEVKAPSDPTRTLVGMARVVSGPAWQDTTSQRFVRSWFNRPATPLRHDSTTVYSTTSTTPVEISSALRLEFLIWADETYQEQHNFGWYASVASNGFFYSTIDGSTDTQMILSTVTGFSVTTGALGIAKDGLSEGYHYASPWFAAAGGATISQYYSQTSAVIR